MLSLLGSIRAQGPKVYLKLLITATKSKQTQHQQQQQQMAQTTPKVVVQGIKEDSLPLLHGIWGPSLEDLKVGGDLTQV